MQLYDILWRASPETVQLLLKVIKEQTTLTSLKETRFIIHINGIHGIKRKRWEERGTDREEKRTTMWDREEGMF